MNKVVERILRWGSLAMYVACSITILVEASLDGTKSGNRSGIITNFVNQIIDNRHDRETIKEIENFDISFDGAKEDSTYYVGDVLSYSVTYSPSNTSFKGLSWNIEHNDVLEINENECSITFIKEGTTSVSITSQRNQNLKKEFSFTVKNIPVENLTVYYPPSSINVGDAYQLTANVSPENATNKELIYSSSSPDIVKINSLGIFQGKKKGRASITVQSADDETLSKTIEIEVTDSERSNYVPVDSSKFSLSFEEKKKANDYNSPSSDFSKIPLGCKITPIVQMNEDATNKKVFINIDDEDILSYVKEEKTLIPLKEGKTKLTITSQDNIDLFIEKEIEIFNTSSPIFLDLEKMNPLHSKINYQDDGQIDNYEITLDYGISYQVKLNTLINSTSSTIKYERLDDPMTNNAVSIDGSGNITTSNIGKDSYKIIYGDYQTYSLNITFIVERNSLFTWSQLNTLMRKSIGHFGLFALTSIFACIFISMTFKKMTQRLIATSVSLVAGFSLAGFSELIQLFTPGRTCAWADVGIDTLGYFLSIFVYLIVLLIIWLISRKKKKSD